MRPNQLASKQYALLLLCLFLAGCVSGPLKINQSGTAADVVEEYAPRPVTPATYKVLIIPSGAIQTNYISDKTSTVGGLIGSMIIGPTAGFIGGIAGSTAGSKAASSAEEAASKNIDSQDISRAIAPANLPVYFSEKLATQLKKCGIEASIYPSIIEPTTINWADSHLSLPNGFKESAAPYRFFMQAGLLNIKLKSGIKDDTLEERAYVRVYETQTFKQIGRYSYDSGTTGSVTLNHYSKHTSEQNRELSEAAKEAAQYLVNGIGTDICSVMKNF